MESDDELTDEEIQELLDNPVTSSTGQLEEYVVPAYINETWSNLGNVEDLIPDEHVSEKEFGFTKPQFRADEETDLDEMAELIDDTISEIAEDSENAIRMIWDEERRDLGKIGAGAGVLVGAPAYMMTMGSPAPGLTLLIEGGAFMSSAALIQDGARNIMDTYDPGEIVKSMEYSARKAANKYVLGPIGATELDEGELPADATVVERKEELRDDIYLLDPDHRRIEAGELEEIVGETPEYLRQTIEDEPDLDTDDLHVDPEELYEDMVTVREDALDGTFYQLLVDITDTEAYADEVAEEAFVTDEYDHIETLDDAIAEGRAYHIRDFHEQRGADPDDATVDWSAVRLSPTDRQTVRDIRDDLDSEEYDVKLAGDVLETTGYDAIELVIESERFEELPVTEYRSLQDELDTALEGLEEQSLEEQDDGGVEITYTAERNGTPLTITCTPDLDGPQYVF